MKKLLTVWWQDHLTAHISFKKDLWKGVVAGPARPRLRSRSRCMLSEYTGLTTTSRSRPSDASTRIRKKRKLMQAWFSASFLFSTNATRLSPIRYYPWCIPCYHSYSMIDLWSVQYVVVLIIIWPLYLYRFYELYCFTEIFWVENWSVVQFAMKTEIAISLLQYLSSFCTYHKKYGILLLFRL